MARRLEAAGAEALAMPCNTAHHYAAAIRAAVGIPLIDMVALSVDHASRLAPGGGTVGILASPAVRVAGFFDRALAAAGLTAIHVADEDEVLPIIRRIKANGPTEADRSDLARMSRGLLARGAQVQMVACTEFSLIADAIDGDARCFDTLDRLVAGILAFATSGDAGQHKADPNLPKEGAKAPLSHPNKETTP